MAEEEEGGDVEAGGSVLKKWGPLAAIVLVCQLVLATAFAHFLGGGLFGEDENLEEEDDRLDTERAGFVSEPVENENDLPFYYENDKLLNITGNPAGTNGERFVVFDVELGLVGKRTDEDPFDETFFETDADFTKKMDQVMPRIKSILTEIMRSKTVNELEGEFFKDVKKDMKDRINNEVFNDKKFKAEDADYTISLKDVNVSRLVIQ